MGRVFNPKALFEKNITNIVYDSIRGEKSRRGHGRRRRRVNDIPFWRKRLSKVILRPLKELGRKCDKPPSWQA